MKIAVCVSHVPDTAAKIKIASDGKQIDSAGVTYILNPYDEFAIEQAIKTRDQVGGEVVVISVGEQNNTETIRKALAMGANAGVLLKHTGYLDSTAVAKALANEIKEQECELVFMGKQSIDTDSGVIGQLTAGYLDYSSISTCVAFSLEGNSITAEREIEGGREVVSASLPAIITAQKGLNEPRYPSLKGIMDAKRKTITEKSLEVAENRTEIIDLVLPAPKNAGKIIGTDASAVQELVRLLKDEAKVI